VCKNKSKRIFSATRYDSRSAEIITLQSADFSVKFLLRHPLVMRKSHYIALSRETNAAIAKKIYGAGHF
jgi:hypothetical protein